MYDLFLSCNQKISTDSRNITPGSIFFALRGEAFDGNRFAISALENGAAWAVVDDPELVEKAEDPELIKRMDDQELNNNNSLSGRLILVENTLEALQSLAAEHRRKLGIPVLALTGSNGKTTTKEFTKLVLEQKYRVGATVGNLNNHIGVPLTLLSFDTQIEIGIIEMGANHQQEIAQLCRIAQPNVGLITNIGRAHLEGFGGAEGIERGKGELYDYLLESSGVAIYNLSDDTLARMIEARVGLQSIGYDPSSEPLKLSIYGAYNQLNAQAAYAIGVHFGVDPRSAARAIRDYLPKNNRSQVITTERNTLYMDAYNANPSSMRIALETFSRVEAENRVLILGGMRELGSYSLEEHRALVDFAWELGFREVYLVGTEYLHLPLRAGYVQCDGVDSLREYMTTSPISGQHILIKGSRGVGLERLIDLL